MRFLQLTVLSFILAIAAAAQIPNPGFESWSSGEPDGWTTNNSAPDFVSLTQVSTAHSGASAIKGATVDVGFGFFLSPLLFAGPDGAGFPWTQRSGSLTAYYQFSPSGGDRLIINVILYKGGVSGTDVGGGAVQIGTAASTFTPVTIPIVFTSGENPDSATIVVTIIGPSVESPVHGGTFYIIDDFAFGGAVGVENDKPGIPDAMKLGQNYPNPFNPSTVIDYDLPAGGFVTLKVYNVIGQEVTTLVNDMMPAGRHQAVWSASGLPSGVYTYRLTAQGEAGSKPVSLSGRMILAK